MPTNFSNTVYEAYNDAFILVYNGKGLNSAVLQIAPVDEFDFQDTQYGGCGSGRFYMRMTWEQAGNMLAPNMLAAYLRNSQLSAKATTGTNTVTVSTGDGARFKVGQPIALWDGNNTYEIHTITAISGDTLTVSGLLSNTWTAGYPVYALRYRGMISGRVLDASLDPRIEVDTVGYQIELTQWVIPKFAVNTSSLPEVGYTIYQTLLQAQADGGIPDLVINSANFVMSSNGSLSGGTQISYNGTSTMRFLSDLLNDMVKTANSGATPYTLWIDTSNNIHFSALNITTPSVSVNVYGAAYRSDGLQDVLTTQQTTDNDITQIVNSLFVIGGTDPTTQNIIECLVEDDTSIAKYGRIQGTVSNTNLTSESDAEAYGKGQLKVLAYPRQSHKTEFLCVGSFATCQDYVQITGFTDGSSVAFSPISVDTIWTAGSGQFQQRIQGQEMIADVTRIMRDIALEHYVGAQTSQAVSYLADRFVQYGLNGTYAGSTFTVAQGAAVFQLSTTPASAVVTALGSTLLDVYNSNPVMAVLGPSGHAFTLPNGTSTIAYYYRNTDGSLSGSAQYVTFSGVTASNYSGALGTITDYQVLPLYTVTVLNGNIVGVDDRRNLASVAAYHLQGNPNPNQAPLVLNTPTFAYANAGAAGFDISFTVDVDQTNPPWLAALNFYAVNHGAAAPTAKTNLWHQITQIASDGTYSNVSLLGLTAGISGGWDIYCAYVDQGGKITPPVLIGTTQSNPQTITPGQLPGVTGTSISLASVSLANYEVGPTTCGVDLTFTPTYTAQKAWIREFKVLAYPASKSTTSQDLYEHQGGYGHGEIKNVRLPNSGTSCTVSVENMPTGTALNLYVYAVGYDESYIYPTTNPVAVTTAQTFQSPALPKMPAVVTVGATNGVITTLDGGTAQGASLYHIPEVQASFTLTDSSSPLASTWGYQLVGYVRQHSTASGSDKTTYTRFPQPPAPATAFTNNSQQKIYLHGLTGGKNVDIAFSLADAQGNETPLVTLITNYPIGTIAVGALPQMPVGATISATNISSQVLDAGLNVSNGNFHIPEVIVTFTLGDTNSPTANTWGHRLVGFARKTGGTNYTAYAQPPSPSSQFGNGVTQTLYMRGFLPGQTYDLAFALADAQNNQTAKFSLGSVVIPKVSSGGHLGPIIGKGHLIGDTSGDTTTAISDGTHLVHGVMSAGTQAAIDSSGNQLNLEFVGGKEQQDGSMTYIDGKSSATQYTLVSGQPFTVSADIARTSTYSNGGALILGSDTNGYQIGFQSGYVTICKWVAGVRTNLGSVAMTDDTAYHTYRLTVTPGATNLIEGSVDANYLSASDAALSLTTGTWPVKVYTAGAAGKMQHYTASATTEHYGSLSPQAQGIIGQSQTGGSYLKSGVVGSPHLNTGTGTNQISNDTIPDGTTYGRIRGNQLIGGALSRGSVGKNILPNPSFELNDVKTTVTSWLSTGNAVGNGWYIHDIASCGGVQLEQESGWTHSGSNNLLLSAFGGYSIPANSVEETRIYSGFFPVKAGDTFKLSGWVRSDFYQTLPTGLQIEWRLGLFIFDNNQANGSEVSTASPKITSGSGAYSQYTASLSVPNTVGSNGTYPAVACVQLCLFVENTSGAAIALPGTISNRYDVRFDDIEWVNITNLDTEVVDGTTYARVKGSELASGTVKQLNDGTNVRTAVHVANAIDTSSRIIGSLYDGTNTLTPANVTNVISNSGTGIDAVKPGTKYQTLPVSTANRNLIPDSNFKTFNASSSLYWTPGSYVLLPGQGADGGNAIGLLGTGSAQSVSASSKVLYLVPNQQYILSGFIDCTNVTGGSPVIELDSPNGGTGWITDVLPPANGTKARQQRQFTAPSLGTWAASTAYTKGTFIKDSNGNVQVCSVAGTSGASAPTWNATLYGTTTDNTATWENVALATSNIPVQCRLNSNSVVTTSGKYFLASNFQLEVATTAGVATPYAPNEGDDLAGSILIDFKNGSHAGKNLDNIPNGASNFSVKAIDGNGKALIDFSQTQHTNKTLDNIGDGNLYSRVAVTELYGHSVKQLNDGTNVRTAAAVAASLDTSGNLDVSKTQSGKILPRGNTDTSITNAIDSSSNFICTEFTGGKERPDGSYTGVDGKSSVVLYTLANGQPFSVSADIARASTGVSPGRLVLGNTTNGYAVAVTNGQARILKFVSGTTTALTSAAFVDDTNYHSYRLTITPGTSNSLEVSVDNVILTATDAALSLTTGTWPVTIHTAGSAGTMQHYMAGGALFHRSAAHTDYQNTVNIGGGINLASSLHTNLLPLTKSGKEVTDVIGSSSGNGQINLSPSGGVAGQLATANLAGASITNAKIGANQAVAGTNLISTVYSTQQTNTYNGVNSATAWANSGGPAVATGSTLTNAASYYWNTGAAGYSGGLTPYKASYTLPGNGSATFIFQHNQYASGSNGYPRIFFDGNTGGSTTTQESSTPVSGSSTCSGSGKGTYSVHTGAWGAPYYYTSTNGAVQTYQCSATTAPSVSYPMQLVLSSVNCPSTADDSSSLTITLTDPTNTVVQTWTGITAATTLTYTSGVSGPWVWSIQAINVNTDNPNDTPYSDSLQCTWSGTMQYPTTTSSSGQTYVLAADGVTQRLTSADSNVQLTTTAPDTIAVKVYNSASSALAFDLGIDVSGL